FARLASCFCREPFNSACLLACETVKTLLYELHKSIPTSSCCRFQALIGHRYGAAGLPARVEVTEYQLLLHQSQQAGVSTQELEGEYRRDENSIPASYRRTPSSRHTCAPPVSAGKTSLHSASKFLQIKLNGENPLDTQVEHMNCIQKDLESNLTFKNSILHFQALTFDSDGDQLLSELCDSFLPEAVTARQLLVYTTTTECDPRHGYTTTRRRGYAESLCQQAHCDLLRLTDGLNVPEVRGDALRREQAEQEELCGLLSGLYEVKHVCLHANQEDPSCCTTNTGHLGSSCSSTSALHSHQEPCVHGPGLNQWNQPCLEPEELHWILLKPDITLSDIKDLLSSLLSLLPSKNRPLVLLLDGLDQLENGFGPQIIESLPSPLPPHVRLILTASCYRTRLLHAITLHYLQHSAGGEGKSVCEHVQLGPLDRKQGVKMLASLLGGSGRRVTSGQQALLNQTLSRCGLPLYVRLLHTHTSLWRSDSDVTDSSLPDCVHSAISAFLDLLQLKHGSSLVERAVSIITLSRAGLTESELADLLSRHSESKVTQVDLEQLLLDLKGFLVRRTAAGSQVLQWMSRHFKLVVAKRFLGSEEVRRQIHVEIADYFSGRCAHGGDESNGKDGFISHINKHPSGRPFVFTAFSDVVQVSLRRVVELPHHLKQSGRWEDLQCGLFVSFSFHQAMVQAGLLAELVSVLETCEDSAQAEFLRERLLLAGILKSSACFLQSSPLQLCAVMESGLLPYLEVFPTLKSYVSDIRLERIRRGSGLGISLSPSPSSVLPIQHLKHSNKTKDHCVTGTAAAEFGVVVELLSDGTAWVWKGCGCAVTKLSLMWEETELKFAGVKSSGGLILLSTQCHKHFVCHAAGPEMFQIKAPLRPTSESSQTLNKVEGFVSSQKKLLMWWKDENFVSVFDTETEIMTYFQCQSSVTCVVVSSDGCSVYCGQEGGSVSIFDTESSSLLGTCSNSNHGVVASIILSEDSQKMACVDRTGNVALWDVAAKTQPARLVKEIFHRGKSNKVLSTDYSAETDSLLLCGAEQVSLYDTCSWELWDQFLAPHQRAFSHALLSQDGHLLLALLESCTLVLVWRITSGECVLSLETNRQPHALLKTDTDIICVAQDGCLTVWDSEMIAAAETTPKMKCGVKALMVDPKGKWFYSADGSERVWRWRLDSKLPHACFLHGGPVDKLQLSPNGVHLVSLSAGDIYVWQTASGDNVVRIRGSRATDILITPNSHFGVSISERGLSRVWRLAQGSVVCSIHLYLSDAQVSPEGAFLIGRRRGDLVAASLWSGSISKRFSCVEGSEHVTAFHTLTQHPDYVLVMAASGAVYTWKVTEETACRHFQLPQAFLCRPQDFQMSSDCSYALLSTDHGTINLLDLSQVRLCTFKSDGPIIKACLDKKGSFAVYVSQPASLEKSCTCFLHTRPVLTAIRLSDGETMGRVSLPKNPLTLAVCGQLVFVGLEDGSVAVYSLSSVTVSENQFRSRGDLNSQILFCFKYNVDVIVGNQGFVCYYFNYILSTVLERRKKLFKNF
uniref:Uncharacterized protein n=1 Tax=Salarias fasciatus TaxID=181472 RepID=A0A672F3F3_SALFA